jgi:hypothetical protein
MDATMTATPADGTPAPEDKTPLERLTEAVEANLLDFTAWTQLLAHLESDVRLLLLRWPRRLFEVLTRANGGLLCGL